MTATGNWLWDNWALLAMVGTCASLAAFVIWLLTKYTHIALNIFTDTPPPLLGAAIDYPLLPGEAVRFRSFDGTSLRGMHLRARTVGEPKGTIIFCHEFGSDMFSCARYARPLLDAGFDLFTFDFRGHGQSSPSRGYKPLQWPSDKDLEDVLGACAYVESELEAAGRPVRVGLFGMSRGAGSALLAAAADPCVRAVVSDGAFSTETTIIAFMKRWASIFARVKLVYENHTETFWRFMTWLLFLCAQRKLGCRYPSVRRALREMQPRPIFFIHGERDTYIQVEQTELLHATAPSPKYRWIVPGAKHNQGVVAAPREYAQRTVAFFCLHLAGEGIDEGLITGDTQTHVA